MSMTLSSATRTPLRVAFRAPVAARSINRNAVRRNFVVYAKDPEQAIKDAGKNIQQGVEGALNKGEKELKNLSDKAGDVTSDAQRTGEKQAGKAESAAKGASSDAQSAAKGASKDAQSAAKDAAGKIESEGKGLGDAIKGGIADAADAVKGKAKDLKDSVSN